ncbi:MAG: hypothetical protein PUC29_03755 [Clostridia bacterium]|nr:hypothetical protein [Clostridia bacterium]
MGGSVILDVKYENGLPISNGSFFGIGNDTYPFKGKFLIGGSADTSIAIGDNSWRYLFNNLSNEAQIVSGGNYYLYSSYVAQNESPQEADSFAFCRTLSVTKQNGELNISGFRFGATAESGKSGALVKGDSLTALFACQVKKSGADSFSVDLSKSLTSGTYVVESTADDAGGLFGTVEAGVNATVGLPQSLTFNVKADGFQKNAGVLIASNFGNVTFVAGSENQGANKGFSFTGELSSTGSSGLIGASKDASQTTFSENVVIDALKASGLRAGGIAGTGNGLISIKNAEIKNSSFTRIATGESGRLGGAVGSADKPEGGLRVADGCSVKLSGNTFTANGDACVGGYMGYLNTSGEDLKNISVLNNIVTGSGNSADKLGGYIGSLTTAGDFTLSLTDESSAEFSKITAGVCGGIIGEVNADLQYSVVLAGAGASGSTVNCTVNNSSAAVVGGLVGRITKGYFKVDDLSLNNSIERTNTAADIAGAVNPGAVLDAGKLSLYEAKGSVLVGKIGKGSVVRLRGEITDTSASVQNLVYEQDASLIYKDVDCTYTGEKSANNDIGNYGQVVRNDTLRVISFNETTHGVSLVGDPLSGSGDISVAGVTDFAKLAITFHTKGAISGVDGVTADNYSALFGRNINLTADVSLDNTGIEQLTPSNDITTPYTGTLSGGGNTVTLAIGQNIHGSNPGVKAGANNKRNSLALFSYIKNATVNNVNIGGKIYLCLPDADQYVGSLAGKADGELSLKRCSVNTEIKISNGVAKKNNKTSLYVGGAVGYIGDVSRLSATNCTLGASISDSTNNAYYTADNNRLSYGGFSGYVSYTGTDEINFQNNTIKTTVEKSSSYSNLKIGGFIGELKCANYVTANMRGTKAQNVSITANSATGSSGGILGYSFDKCHVILNREYSGTVKTGVADLGGLLYTMNGRLTAEKGFAVTGTKLTSSGELRGLLLADGKTALVTVKSSPDGFRDVTADDGFDLFVGENIEDYTSVEVAASGGIVTVETGDALGKLPNNSDWYALINSRENTKTRYYFNIAGLENITDASETVRNETDLMYWHVVDYAVSLPDYVKTEFFHTTVNSITSVTSVTSDINMTDYCFYPTEKEAVTIDFKGHKLTFGKTVSVNAANQFFGLQAGLLSDINDGGAKTEAQINRIKLAGQASYLGNDLGSGALICGTVSGSNVNNNRFDVVLTVSDVTLSGLSVETASDYRPMLINRIASYTESSVSGIKQEEYTDVSSAASSLIGKGGMLEGSTPSSFVKMTLSNVVLDAKKADTVFTKASLFYDVLYESGSGSFIYNFNFGEDWGVGLQHQVTYGAELYLNEDQRTYFDKNIPVNPETKPTEASELYNFQNYYLPYVYTGYDLVKNKTNINLSVNRKGADLIEGYGTYHHPYIIRSAKQLEYVSKLLSGNNEPFSDGWKINFPSGSWGSLSTLDLTGYYTVQAVNGDLCRTDLPSDVLSREVLLAYLSGAYFKLADDSNPVLSSGYAGLGSTAYPFHGVIHGNGVTVTMPDADTAIGSYGYGFINVANGCAVYNLKLSYGTVVLSSDAFTDGQTPTSGPADSTLSTTLPHFGGAIAWVAGGDNLLDKVSVSVGTVTPGACHTVCGGYVGMVSGGGVLLSELGELTLNKSSHLYHNNYVGRVLDGYALAFDGKTYDNSKVLLGLNETRADFIIPAITKDVIVSHNSGFVSGNTFSLANARDLLLFSFAMNSGAFAGNTGYAYGSTSLSRYGDYSHVGDEAWSGVNANGRYSDDVNKTAVLSAYFGVNTPTDLQSTALTVKLTGTQYDLGPYGNAFRAVSGAYSKSLTYKIASFGGDTQKATVYLDMDMLQYAVGKKDSDGDKSFAEPDSIRRYGLFGSISNTVTFRNVVLSGKISVSCIDSGNKVMESDPFNRVSVNDGVSVGGFVGISNGAVTFTDASLKDITVNSPDVCGGFVGRHASGNFTVESGCSYENATVKGKRHTGGIAGYVGSGTVSITGLKATDSIVETRVDLRYMSGTLYGTAGGVIGYVGSGTSSVTLTDCTVTKTAAVYTANYKNTGDYVASGGLVGYAEKSISANNCTVDGCVVLAVSNFGSGSVFPDTLSPSKNTLSDSFKNSVVYNGDKQNVANLLAWMLEQKADDGGGYSVGAAGGILGEARNNAGVTLNNCTVSAVNAPSVIAAFNDAGGLIGEQRGGTDVSITGCRVKTDGYDMYIVGGPRAAGVIAYRNTTGTPTYTINDFQIEGTAANPIRILGIKYNTTDAAGIIGDINKANLTAENCKVSYCIIGGSRAAGAWSNVIAGSNISFNNIEISNNLIYSKHKDHYAGGLLCYANAASAVDGVCIGNNYIVGVTGAGGMTGQLIGGNSLSAKYVILDDNVIRKISAKVSDFTFAANSLADGAAADALYDTAKTSFTNVGLIAGNNSGSVTAIAVSCSDPDAGDTRQKNFGTGAGTGTVVYAAYGAQEPYKTEDLTPQQAIEKMSLDVSVGAEQRTLYGDSVTTGTPQEINSLTWWPYKDTSFVLGDTAITALSELVPGVTENGTLPLLCLNEKTDATMKGYINMLTAGGFDSAVSNDTGVTVASKRYSVADNGNLTDLDTDGSVVYSDGKFSAGVYDNLEGDVKTLTVLSIKYSDVYTMHVAIYYHRSVNLKTFVVPLEGEQYYLPSFLNFASEPNGSLRTNVSFGSPFTLYVEYNYNDMAMTLENLENFNKQIELTQSNGVSDESARIEKGTEFILIDLNSESPSGYTYYTLALDKDERFINFSSFTNESTGDFGHIPLSEIQNIAHLAQNRICKDTSDCVFTEKYLMVVFPVQNNTDNAITYNMKAVIDEEQRQATNIVVKRLKEVYGQVSVWSSPNADMTADYVSDTALSKQFSNLSDNPIQMNVTSTVNFANGYVTALQSQNGAVYGTHVIRLRNEKNQYVELPMRTAVKVETPDGEVIYENELADATSQIRFSVGDILKKVTTGNRAEMSYRITLDFSGVNQNDFNSIFAVMGQSSYTLVDSLYLSADSELLGSGPWDAFKEYTVSIDTGVKLAVVPTDNRHLGINLIKQEDETNNGKIDFSVVAKFDAFAGKTFDEATVSFSVSKKVFEGGVYKYVELENEDPLKWTVSKDGAPVNSDVLTVVDKECSSMYRLDVDINQEYGPADLTNYRLIVNISATADDGTTIGASEYFVFLLCKLETEPPA